MAANLDNVVEAIKELTLKKDSYPFNIPSGTGAVSVTTDLRTRYPGKEVEIISVEVKWSSAPTTSENFTVTLQRAPSTANVLIFSIDPSTTGLTSMINTWAEDAYLLQPGDEVVIAYTNTDARTISGRLIVRPKK